ncbi:unnamed protein product, partial [marine sediment metagenome]
MQRSRSISTRFAIVSVSVAFTLRAHFGAGRFADDDASLLVNAAGNQRT